MFNSSRLVCFITLSYEMFNPSINIRFIIFVNFNRFYREKRFTISDTSSRKELTLSFIFVELKTTDQLRSLTYCSKANNDESLSGLTLSEIVIGLLMTIRSYNGLSHQLGPVQAVLGKIYVYQT
jgi:hypothetical protein